MPEKERIFMSGSGGEITVRFVDDDVVHERAMYEIDGCLTWADLAWLSRVLYREHCETWEEEDSAQDFAAETAEAAAEWREVHDEDLDENTDKARDEPEDL